MKFSIHNNREIFSLIKPHPDAFKEPYRYVNLETGKAERIDRWVLEINSIAELKLLHKKFGYYIIVPSIDVWDELYMLIICGKEKPDFLL